MKGDKQDEANDRMRGSTVLEEWLKEYDTNKSNPSYFVQ
jgi:hypothetical protein